MSQAEDLLDSLPSEGEAAQYLLSSLASNEEVEEHIVIGNDRFVTVPESLKKIAVQYDHNVRTVTFDCPRYCDGRDLSTMIISINYVRPDGELGLYQPSTVTIDETDNTIIHFDWVIKSHVTSASGTLSFLVCAKKLNDDGTSENHWNTELNQEMKISKGLSCSETIAEEYPDLITQILTRLYTVEERSALAVLRREDTVEDANEHTTTGYAKTEYGVTQNLPEQVYGQGHAFSSEWGILFFIAENVDHETGIQIFYPVDGPYKGRVFVRSLTNMNYGTPSPGPWTLLATESGIETNYQKKPKSTSISLPISGWTGSGLLYSQEVTVPIITANSQVELRPSPAQLQELLTSEISLTAANESGTVTVFAIGGKPISDYTMQIIVSEVKNV